MKHVDDFLMFIGVGTYTAYAVFKATSDFCKDIMPILSVASFVIYIIINWTSIKAFFKKKV